MLLFELGPPGAAGGFAGNCQTAPKKKAATNQIYGSKNYLYQTFTKIG